MNDPFVSCPYDAIHRVPRSRLQRHIVKCKKNYPDYEACPYNATHRYPPDKIRAHVLECPSKFAIFPEDVPQKVIASITTPRPILQKEYIPENDPNNETWDD